MGGVLFWVALARFFGLFVAVVRGGGAAILVVVVVLLSVRRLPYTSHTSCTCCSAPLLHIIQNYIFKHSYFA
jgi:hypothetical protein